MARRVLANAALPAQEMVADAGVVVVVVHAEPFP
jgi:hypothetical protein